MIGADLAKRAASAARIAQALIDAAHPASAANPYIARKQIVSDGLLEIDLAEAVRIIGYAPSGGKKQEPLDGPTVVVVPMYIDGTLSTCELIDSDGRKSFLAGGRTGGGYWSTAALPDSDWTDDLTILIGEGVATVVSASMATGHLGVAAMSCGNLLSVGKSIRERYPHAKIIFVADLGIGVTKSTEAARTVGGFVAIPQFPQGVGGKDVNDLHVVGGIEAVKTCFEAATKPAAETVTPDATVRHLRPEIVVGTDMLRVTDEAIAALALAAQVYVRGPEIAEVVTDDPATRGVTRSGPLVRIHRSPEPRIRELLADHAQWLSTGRDGESLVSCQPPLWVARTVMSRGRWPGLRPLVAVAEAPTMRPDGTILGETGYDPATAIYLAPGMQVSVPELPTRDHAVAAAEALLDVIADFPVASEAGRSAWVAGVITAAVRSAIDGPAPMWIVDASAPGSGKTLMVDATATITTGRDAARTIYASDDAEMRKRITAIALAGDPLILLDNVSGTLGCPSLDAALTGTTWRDRLLGSSAMTAELPMRTVWMATGNGLVIGADLVRRALLVRLEPMTERPEERTGFRHPRLLDYVRKHRAELLSAALTIPRAYVVAGRPDQRLTPMGSYTAWSDLVRSAIVWAGMADPCATIAEIRATDPRADALRAVLRAWPVDVDRAATVAELLTAATSGAPWRAALVEWCPPRGTDQLPTARAVGNRLRGVRRRVVDDRYLDAGPHGERGVPWVLRTTGHRPPAADSLTLLTPVSRYACVEGNENRDIAGETVSRVIESGEPGPSPDNDEVWS
jgi:putative DNA primase/helicase